MENNEVYRQFQDLNTIINGQQTLIYSMAQMMNLQNQAINEINQKLNSALSKLTDIEIRVHMNDEVESDISQNVQQMLQLIDDLKFKVDNIKVYQLPSNYFE